MNRLRLHIDGEWKAHEFAEFFDAIDRYYRFLGIRFSTFALQAENSIPIQRVQQLGSLQVTAVKYGSKGITDLAGFAAIIREIRKFVQFLILHVSDRKGRKLARETRELENLRVRIDLLEHLEKVRRARDSSEPGLKISSELTQFSELPDYSAILDAISDGRLIGAELLDDDRQ